MHFLAIFPSDIKFVDNSGTNKTSFIVKLISSLFDLIFNLTVPIPLTFNFLPSAT